MADKLFIDSVLSAITALEAREYRKALMAVETTRNSFDIDIDCTEEVQLAHVKLGETACEALSMIGNHEEAIGEGTQCVESYPNRWEGHLLLARVLQRAGKLEEARRAIGRAYQLSPKNSVVSVAMVSIETDIKIQQTNRMLGGGDASPSASSSTQKRAGGNGGGVEPLQRVAPTTPITSMPPKSPRLGGTSGGLLRGGSRSSPTGDESTLRLNWSNVNGGPSPAAAVVPIQRTTAVVAAPRTSSSSSSLSPSTSFALSRVAEETVESDSARTCETNDTHKNAVGEGNISKMQPFSSKGNEKDFFLDICFGLTIFVVGFAVLCGAYHCKSTLRTSARDVEGVAEISESLGRVSRVFAVMGGAFPIPADVYAGAFLALVSKVALNRVSRGVGNLLLLKRQEKERAFRKEEEERARKKEEAEAAEAERLRKEEEERRNARQPGHGKVSVRLPGAMRRSGSSGSLLRRNSSAVF